MSYRRYPPEMGQGGCVLGLILGVLFWALVAWVVWEIVTWP